MKELRKPEVSKSHSQWKKQLAKDTYKCSKHINIARWVTDQNFKRNPAKEKFINERGVETTRHQ